VIIYITTKGGEAAVNNGAHRIAAYRPSSVTSGGLARAQLERANKVRVAGAYFSMSWSRRPQ
jgi:hypothetical protein